jgi:hypothetical protein
MWNTIDESNLFSSVTAAELTEVVGGVVVVEYLLLATFLGLALVVGMTSVTAQHNSVDRTSRPLTAVR